MNPKVVISWVLILSLPINIILSYMTYDANFLQVSLKSSIAFLYLALFSMYIGFFFWYEGLLVGGVARVSQVQLLQPFITMIAASFLLDDELTALNLVFATLVVLTVMIGKKMLIVKSN
jgi:drug/metabolite transporter (DMT)-like permease